MKLVTIVGARPQFVKAAVLCRLIDSDPNFSSIQSLLIHTGQHYDHGMSDVFFEEMGIPTPDFNLKIAGGNHGEMTGRMLEKIESVLLSVQADCVLVYGDTNSTLAGALAAAKLHIPIAHVEAGMRCFDRRQPEEMNRILTDHCSDLLFTTSALPTQHLLNEGISAGSIHEVGDIMYDAALYYQSKAKARTPLLCEERYGLVSIHRAENTDDPTRLGEICQGLIEVSKFLPLVLPLHPRTRVKLEASGDLKALEAAVKIIDPLGYLDMVNLETRASLILSDSGGVQREAHFFNVPCLVLRDRTEWTELITHGGHKLAHRCSDIVQRAEELLQADRSLCTPLYGDAQAGGRIAQELLKYCPLGVE